MTSPSRVEVTAPSIDTLLARDDVLLLAHAGGNLDAPQETLYAYRRAAEAGSDALELDVMLTADRVLVVHHDDTVDRLTNGIGAIADMTLAAVQSLDAAHWFIAWDSSPHDRPAADYELRGIRTGEIAPPPGFSADDFRIPTFREVALAFPHLPLDVEADIDRFAPDIGERYDGPEGVEDFVRFAKEELGLLVRVRPTKILALDRVGEH